MTKREYFAKIREIVIADADLVAFVDHEVELLNKKNSAPRGKTPKQYENEGFKAEILAGLSRPMTISEIADEILGGHDLTNQRVSALVTQLVNDGSVVRTVEKRKAYFSKA